MVGKITMPLAEVEFWLIAPVCKRHVVGIVPLELWHITGRHRPIHRVQIINCFDWAQIQLLESESVEEDVGEDAAFPRSWKIVGKGWIKQGQTCKDIAALALIFGSVSTLMLVFSLDFVKPTYS